MKKQKNFAFIDSQNLNLGIQSQGWKLDWRKFRQYLRDKYQISKAYLFIGYVDGNSPLYTYLQTVGYILIFKPTLELPDGKVKGNVDAELVLHTMIEYPNYTKAMIVSGDGDFYCLVEYLQVKKKLLFILAPNRHYSGLLRKFNNFIIRVDVLRNSLEKTKAKISGRSKP
ncbi:MAG: NYN domain-containing protein [Patescibacteria group bacterium]